MSDFKAKMHQIRFRLWGCVPDPAGGATALDPRCLYSWITGGLLLREREGKAEKGEGKGRVEKGGEKRGAQATCPAHHQRARLRVR